MNKFLEKMHKRNAEANIYLFDIHFFPKGDKEMNQAFNLYTTTQACIDYMAGRRNN